MNRDSFFDIFDYLTIKNVGMVILAFGISALIVTATSDFNQTIKKWAYYSALVMALFGLFVIGIGALVSKM